MPYVLISKGNRRGVGYARTERMKLGYDVFRQLDDGSPIWITNVQTRTQAEQKVVSLRRSAPARYFIRDAETGAVITTFEPGALGEIDAAG